MELLFELLHIIGLPISDTTELNGLYVKRETLLQPHVIQKFMAKLPLLRSYYSSHTLTALHANSVTKQKNPAICLLRQILHTHGYCMMPTQTSNGYYNGRKQFRRSYDIKLIPST
jgi:hypothetical protein